MKYIKTCLCLLLFQTAYATDYTPWFTPPFEFQGRAGYVYEHADTVQSPLGSFSSPTDNSSAHFSLAVTPWPYWNVETELFLTHTADISFAYEAALVTVRYAWLDDILGDCVTLATGATLSFPGSRFLHIYSFPYHGTVNTEFHATLGKEWACGCEWQTRAWALAGYGIANRGSGWIHGLAAFEYRLHRCTTATLFAETLCGLGDDSIIPFIPFEGYASISHRNVNLGAALDYALAGCYTLTLLGWYSPYAHNFIDHSWGASLSLLLPFSIL
jgi:hypothetical protein